MAEFIVKWGFISIVSYAVIKCLIRGLATPSIAFTIILIASAMYGAYGICTMLRA